MQGAPRQLQAGEEGLDGRLGVAIGRGGQDRRQEVAQGRQQGRSRVGPEEMAQERERLDAQRGRGGLVLEDGERAWDQRRQLAIEGTALRLHELLEQRETRLAVAGLG